MAAAEPPVSAVHPLQPAALILAVVTHGAAASTRHAGGGSDHGAAAMPAVVTQACTACHGRHGNSTDPGVPSLAGQGSIYLQKQLLAFKSQRRVGVMSGIAMDLSDADVRSTAAYFSRQLAQWNRLRSIDPQVSARGHVIYDDGITAKDVPACASCHALDGAGLPPEFPRLAGQHARYLAAQLRAFRSDDRLSHPDSMMHKVSVQLSDQEMQAVARYIEGMRRPRFPMPPRGQIDGGAR